MSCLRIPLENACCRSCSQHRKRGVLRYGGALLLQHEKPVRLKSSLCVISSLGARKGVLCKAWGLNQDCPGTQGVGGESGPEPLQHPSPLLLGNKADRAWDSRPQLSRHLLQVEQTLGS